MSTGGTPATSKAFHAVLPSLASDHIDRLRRYCQANFAASAVFVDAPGGRTDCTTGHAQVVWLATRDRTRGSVAHRRSARAVLTKLGVPTAGLRGAWLVLATEEAVRAAAAEHSARSAGHAPATADEVAQPPRGPRAPRASADAQDAALQDTPSDPDVKVVRLRLAEGPYRGGTATPFSFEVLR